MAGVAGPPGAHRPARWWCWRDGVPLVWLDRRSHHLVTFPDAARRAGWAEALADLVKDGRLRSVEVRKVDGETLADVAGHRRRHRRGQAAGFIDGYRGLQYTARPLAADRGAERRSPVANV